MTKIINVSLPKDDRGNDPNDWKDDPDYAANVLMAESHADNSQLSVDDPPSPKNYRSTDVGNADRFVDKSGLDWRYCHPTKTWLFYKDGYWQADHSGEIVRATKKIILNIYADAVRESDPDRRQALVKHAARSESGARIKAVYELVKCELPLSPGEFDCDPMLLGCMSGTIDLRTGRPREPRREDHITKTTNIEYDPDAACPEFLAFLSVAMGNNKPLIKFLQRAIGYSLTGLTTEQVLFFLLGTGANGKTVFQSIIKALLCDYATQSSAETLMVNKYKSGSDASPDVSRLRGSRVVLSSEVEDGQRLSESMVKQLTGGDTIVARGLHQSPIEFAPQFKIWLAANHRPLIRGTDHAIWRRIILIPFDITIPPKERDRKLIEKLRKELPGILNWAIAGCLEWQKIGLMPPAEVKAATDEYQHDMDIIGQWIDDRCCTGADFYTGATELFDDYKRWAEANIGWAFKQTAFGRQLTDRGFNKRKTSVIMYVGLSLKS